MIKYSERKNVYLLYIMTLLFCLVTGIILLCGGAEENVASASVADDVPTLIIDPGHGGADGGAVAADGTKESLINLEISLKMKSLSDLLGIKSVIIRESEDLPYPEDTATIAAKKRWDQNRRLELINSTPNCLLLSIHQNYYPDPRPSGAQVLYGAVEGSQQLGELCHEALNSSLCPDNRRVAAPISDKIFLMKNAKCPAILVECGFMSNSDELGKLLSGDYQIKIALILVNSYLAYTAERRNI